MHFRSIAYDAKSKIWSNSSPQTDYFAPDLSIGEIIFHEMRRHPQLIAQISDTEKTILTRENLQMNSMRVASYMRKLRLQQSDIVEFKEETIKKAFGQTKPSLIFCDGDVYDKICAATANFKVKIITLTNHKINSLDIEQVLDTPIEKGFKPARLEKGIDQTLAILCTSGTTGFPKAVTISNSRKIFTSSDNLTTADVQYAYTTLEWIGGLHTIVSSGVYSTTRIIADDEFDPSRELHRIEKYKVTWWRLSPIMVIGLEKTEKFHKTNFASVDYCIIGGDRCPVPVVERFRNRLKAKSVALTYGLSEFGFMVTTNFHLDIKPTSVGCLQCGYKLKILDEQGKILGPNEVGEVLMYSGQYWGGYYGNPEETQRVYDSERWYHTGDMGYVDNDGFLYIIDRKEDMLRYNLSTYFPNEIQNVIEQISDVVEVCVFGLCMDANADIPAAVVVKKKGSKLQAQDVVDYVKEHVEENYKHMDGKVLIVENLIRALGGKINRRVNKEYFLRVMNGN
ncbi:4-coumarate--CoA ligase 1 [Drosophila willistoni]|uniref:4-coumarate--CoA ligase 1 n=1 Tax=Drosophila willistoni TaxID=7260 RepID=UPI001F084997|nr:4-coumarate--CoA ligase 1 [Drosophila willistoni]